MRQLLTPFNLLSLLLLAAAAYAYQTVRMPPPTPAAPQYADEDKGQSTNVTLYFAAKDVQSYVPERRSVTVALQNAQQTAQAMSAALVDGPRKDGLRLVPSGSDVPNVWVRAGHVIVDLPPSYAKLQYGVSGERALLCGFTRTLLGVRNARDVTFLVGGKNVDTLLGFLDLREAFTSEDCPDS
ncbi:GerMN domain-containing protein [Deinococcus yavapaiensis]|uniref:Sporulation and spore germination protein n=1 Tax=Deinococcus yavapaiensis KR-236 TaxID=694435 RepID=A0A318S3R0_9DEIO|nr:GerMN domain-containing protein [Deinococcus yavapaiensis]PYE53039.1 sporulation and spore germination protein [Deinococcus yavapaiensis KR-236]